MLKFFFKTIPFCQSCNCAGSDFTDKDHMHVVTGDLRNVGNNKLKKLFTKGSRYRENNNISCRIAKSTIIEGFNDCFETWGSKHGIDKSGAIEWKSKVIDKVDQKIKTLSIKTFSKFHMRVLKQNNPLKTLNNFHNQFVVMPNDKASENMAFIWQRFYALVLIKKQGLDHNKTGTNETYITVHKANNKVISDVTTILRNKFGLEVMKKTRNFLTFTFAPKLHKHPFKARFKIAAP